MKAILVEKNDEQGYRSSLKDIDEAQLPEGDVTIDVEYSTLNYKDALAITGKSPVVRNFPMVPGIDLVGIVRSSHDSRYAKGQRVVLNGWGLATVSDAHCCLYNVHYSSQNESVLGKNYIQPP